MPPIRPDDAAIRQAGTIPEPVFEAFNELIAQKWDGWSSVVTLHDAELSARAKCRSAGVEWRRHYLNVEEAYRAAGWKVEYDSPGYNETGESYYRFSRM